MKLTQFLTERVLKEKESSNNNDSIANPISKKKLKIKDETMKLQIFNNLLSKFQLNIDDISNDLGDIDGDSLNNLKELGLFKNSRQFKDNNSKNNCNIKNVNDNIDNNNANYNINNNIANDNINGRINNNLIGFNENNVVHGNNREFENNEDLYNEFNSILFGIDEIMNIGIEDNELQSINQNNEFNIDIVNIDNGSELIHKDKNIEVIINNNMEKTDNYNNQNGKENKNILLQPLLIGVDSNSEISPKLHSSAIHLNKIIRNNNSNLINNNNNNNNINNINNSVTNLTPINNLHSNSIGNNSNVICDSNLNYINNTKGITNNITENTNNKLISKLSTNNNNNNINNNNSFNNSFDNNNNSFNNSFNNNTNILTTPSKLIPLAPLLASNAIQIENRLLNSSTETSLNRKIPSLSIDNKKRTLKIDKNELSFEEELQLAKDKFKLNKLKKIDELNNKSNIGFIDEEGFDNKLSILEKRFLRFVSQSKVLEAEQCIINGVNVWFLAISYLICLSITNISICFSRYM
jgi:hypothetical protein